MAFPECNNNIAPAPAAPASAIAPPASVAAASSTIAAVAAVTTAAAAAANSGSAGASTSGAAAAVSEPSAAASTRLMTHRFGSSLMAAPSTVAAVLRAAHAAKEPRSKDGSRHGGVGGHQAVPAIHNAHQ